MDVYQISSIPRIRGKFISGAVFLKCSSIARAPRKNSLKFSEPIPKTIVRPTADHKEKRPPTHSQISKIFSSTIPKEFARFLFPVIATKCFDQADGPSLSSIHFFMVSALRMVSCVENVLDAITTSVVAGSSLRNLACKSELSAFPTKSICICGV